MNNCINILGKILNEFNIPYTKKYLEDIILSHQDHTSLLAISDALTKYKIENAAIKLDKGRLAELPSNCVVQVAVEKSKLFYLIKNIENGHVTFYNDKNKLQRDSVTDFQNLWTGICLLVEKNENSKEIDIEKKLTMIRARRALQVLAILLMATWLLLNFSKVEFAGFMSPVLFASIYGITKLVGLVAGIFLLWFEVDQYNPTLQNFCSGGNKKINCNAVLNSQYATLFKGSLNLSISTIAFSYFFASLIFLFVNGFSNSSISFLGLLSIAASPIVLVSIYYQAFVLKQWCKFCIILQAVLFAETLISYMGGLYHSTLEIFTELPLFISLFILPILAWDKLKPLLENDKAISFYKRKLSKVKNNPDVFEKLLSKSRKITTDTQNLGIYLNGNDTKYHIIKVCNPYCGPCAKAHPILESLYNNGKINMQIIFVPNENESDPALKPIRHLMAIDSHKGAGKTQQALDDWYNAEQKDYKVFANKYTLNGELEKQEDKLHAMREWCKAEKIKHTPTIFINGHELPDEYQVDDLTDILG